jgi:hypothetical protein
LQLWSVQQKENAAAAPTVKFEAELSYHSKAVNVLRFAPSGLCFLAYPNYPWHTDLSLQLKRGFV